MYSVLMFWIKAAYFPAFPTFTVNFAGQGWNHLTIDFVVKRFMHLSRDLPILLTVSATVVLSLFSWRYIVIPVLVSPLLLAQFLSVRDVIGLYHLHYIIPWLSIWIGFVLVASYRTSRGDLSRGEAGILLAAAILSSAPATSALQQPSSMSVLRHSVTGEVTSLVVLAQKLEEAIVQNGRHGACLSIGAVAIVPEAVLPHQVVRHDSNLFRCTRLYVFRGDMDYRRIKRVLDKSSHQLVQEIDDRVEVYLLE